MKVIPSNGSGNDSEASLKGYSNQLFDKDLSSENSPITNGNCNISLAWRNLHCKPTSFISNFFNDNKKTILNQLYGSFEYNTLNGLMGPSGAGKTTFINALIHNLGLTPQSELYINSDQTNSSPTIAFVSQNVHETMINKMKVKHILAFAFRFKNGWLSGDQMRQHIKNILDELMLDPLVLERNFENCSGGEQKRIAIAQELMSLQKPSFLLIDEPTTGLDSNSALLVMSCLKRLVQNNRMTVIVSIHLPNSSILNIIDKLYILAKGGMCIYCGPPSLLKYNLEFQLKIEESKEKPIIEEYLRIACSGVGNRKVDKLVDQTMKQENRKLLPDLPYLRALPNGMIRQDKPFKLTDLFLQLTRLFQMNFFCDWRIFLAVLFTYVIYYSVILPSIYGRTMVHARGCVPLKTVNLSKDLCMEKLNENSMLETYGLYQVMATLFFASNAMLVSALLFVPLFKIFTNEHQNRWYSLSVFFYSFNVLHLFESIIYSSLCTVLIYFTIDHMYIDQNRFNWYRFGLFLFYYWVQFVYMQSIGQLISTITNNLQILTTVLQFFLVVVIVFNGYFAMIDFFKNPIVSLIGELVASRHIINGIMYAVFLLERCNFEIETSVLLEKYSVDPDLIFWNLYRVLINITVFKTASFLVMYFKFSYIVKPTKLFQPSDQEESLLNEVNDNKALTLKPDFDHDKRKLSVQSFQRVKMLSELEFEEFSKNKVHLAWRSLSLFDSNSIYELRSSQDKRSNLILRDLSGQFKFGTMNALMGTSGSGKTSLLNVLNGQFKNRLSEESQFYLSKYTPTKVCFLTQEISGHLIPGLTAKQSLIYASRMKNCNEANQSEIDHEQIALGLLAELEVLNTSNTLVQKCSGGERKRLALALELTALRMPNLICIDEPTSGLDSNSAEVVIDCLSRFVHQHKITIVASIHQPNTNVLMRFDTLYMLARGGVCIYSGPPSQIKNHLIQIPEIQFSEDSFPVEELIKYSCYDYKNSIVQKLAQTNEKRVFSDNIMDDTIHVQDGIPTNRPKFSLNSTWILFFRYLDYVKNFYWFHLAIFTTVYLAQGGMLRFMFPSSIVYENGCVGLEDEDFTEKCQHSSSEVEKYQNLYHGYLYGVFVNQFFAIVVLVHFGFSFLNETVYYYNEHRNGWYSTGVFYSVKSLIEILQMIPIVLIYVYIVDFYGPVVSGSFYWMFLFLMITTISLQGQAHVINMLSGQNLILLAVIIIFHYYCSIMLGNTFKPISEMHYILQWISNLSCFRFLDECLMVILYGYSRCQHKEISGILYRMRISNDDHFYESFRMLILNLIFYRVVAFFWLMIKVDSPKIRRGRVEKIIKYHEISLKPSNAIIPGLSAHQEFRVKKIQV